MKTTTRARPSPRSSAGFEVSTGVVARAMLLRRRQRPAGRVPKRILIAQRLRLGDTLMLTPLIKKLRARYPRATIAMTLSPAMAPIYATRPYGVYPLLDVGSTGTLYDEAPFDLAFVPGNSDYAWLAGAMRARWIVAFANGWPSFKSWPIDHKIRVPDRPRAWGDIVAQLADGAAPAPFHPSEWPRPPCPDFERPDRPYAVLHVGTRSPLKRWYPGRWHQVAESMAERGIQPVWSAGPGEEAVVDAIDPQGRFRSFAAKLNLTQLWHLLADARVLVAPDNGVAHLGRVVGVPTVALFGPGSAVLSGAGEFWSGSAYRAVTVELMPCRNQRTLFDQDIPWVRRCQRGVAECMQHVCMPAIAVSAVENAIESMMNWQA